MDANSLAVKISVAEYQVRNAEVTLKAARENLFNAQERLESLKLQVSEAPVDTRQQLNG